MPGNWYRLNRVLEILLSTGRPLGELNLDAEAPLDYDFRCFFLNRSRLELYRRIDARVEAMVCGGLLQVTPSLQQRPMSQGSLSQVSAAAPSSLEMCGAFDRLPPRPALQSLCSWLRGTWLAGGQLAARGGPAGGWEVRRARHRLPPGHALPAALPGRPLTRYSRQSGGTPHLLRSIFQTGGPSAMADVDENCSAFTVPCGSSGA